MQRVVRPDLTLDFNGPVDNCITEIQYFLLLERCRRDIAEYSMRSRQTRVVFAARVGVEQSAITNTA
ncbi:hypothetical protein [Burkholderia latens]|uniref:hypothetical protein n=1 Tax=Burkholderia latens TaxID=488446 RepID=UPI0039A4F45D